jgi:hypothetical protein
MIAASENWIRLNLLVGMRNALRKLQWEQGMSQIAAERAQVEENAARLAEERRAAYLEVFGPGYLPGRSE